jgi:phenylacetate-coenzyme A ligase PaaK-like adenylate-forming protein
MMELRAERARSQAEFRARLPEHIGRLRWSPGQIAAHQQRELRRVLSHARACSPFYARRLAGIDLDRFTPADLPRLPTLSKAEMMAAFDEVTTDRRLTLRRVEAELARTAELPRLLEGEYVCLASGGSSGLRGIFVWHWQDLCEFALGLMRTALVRVQGTGGPPPAGILGALVAAGSAVHATRAAPMLIHGDIFRWHTVPATLPLAEIVARLNALQPMTLSGYSSLLPVLAREQRAGRLAIAPSAVSGTSEPFPFESRAEVERSFGCPVSESFGSSEGLIGVAGPGELPISLASDLAIVELVDDRHRTVPRGEPSAKALVTTLYNRAHPLIRYELTDRLVQHPDSPDHGHVRITVEGRADDVFVYGERILHPFAVRTVFVKTPEVSEYQVRQTAAGIAVAVVAVAPLDGDALAAKLRAALADAGLRDATASVECVAAIPRHPLTGKVARFVPLSPPPS